MRKEQLSDPYLRLAELDQLDDPDVSLLVDASLYNDMEALEAFFG